jgi:hypothetical protein
MAKTAKTANFRNTKPLKKTGRASEGRNPYNATRRRSNRLCVYTASLLRYKSIRCC